MLITAKKLLLVLFIQFFLVSVVQAQTHSDLFIPSSMQSENMTLLNQALSQGHILVFISSSMPTTSLTQWFKQAEQMGASLILRGLINNSLSETKTWMKAFIEQVNNSGGIEIDPVAFEAYGITQVPAVVVTTGTLQCVPHEQYLTQPFDVVVGNTSLFEALKIIAEKGDVGFVAKQKLAQSKEAT